VALGILNSADTTVTFAECDVWRNQRHYLWETW
jgi:hypothetical protein